MEPLINVANLLYLASYLVHRILWLRALTVVAASLLTVYFYRRPEPIMCAVWWNLGFIALNVVWIARLLVARHRQAHARTAPTRPVTDHVLQEVCAL